MERERRIKIQAEIYTDDTSNFATWCEGGYTEANDISLIEKAFIEGAKWADKHPISNGEELLYVAQKTTNRTKKEVINKACEWIKENIIDYVNADSIGYYVDDEIFIHDFKKAMEE